MQYHVESFTEAETVLLERFVTNLDRPVFALTNLPEVVKGALFARYSRSPKSVRRLLLDEFIGDEEQGVAMLAAEMSGSSGEALEKAQALYQRVFLEYGDDSVAQLGGVHLACEQASNVLTKVLEWGRIASYLEQSTRYIFYDQKLGDRYRFATPPELAGTELGRRFEEHLNWLFDRYSEMVAVLVPHYESRFPRQDGDSAMVWRATIRAKACDTIRGLLPAATTSNVGVYASGQAYEMALVRMMASPLAEVRQYGEMMLAELRKVIPAFMTRVDVPERGVRWSQYLSDVARSVKLLADELPDLPEPRPEVTLVEFDPEGELKLVGAALYSVSELPDDQLLEIARRMSAAQRAEIISAYVGDRTNRRHKPGRAMERTSYRFDVLSDYGAFRDLQRQRMLTLEWQLLTTRHGYDTPEELIGSDLETTWHEAMSRSAELYEAIRQEVGADAAQYVVPFAYNIRYMMQMNAREAFHLIELRTQPAGHPAYRRIAQEMHRLIGEQAGHTAIAEAMSFVDYSTVELERLEQERRTEQKRLTQDR